MGLRLDLQLEQSAAPGSIITTDAANKAKYTAPGANGTVLTVVAGLPTYQAITFPSEYEQYANEAARPATGVVDVIYYATAENTFSIWTGAAYVNVPTSTAFTVAGDAGTNQSIVGGNTLTVKGATASGVVVTGVATDTLEISLTEERETFTPAAAATTITLAFTPTSLQIYRNGMLQRLTTNYTIAGAVITLVDAVAASSGATLGETFDAIYRR